MTYNVFIGMLNPAQSNPVIDGTDWTESKLLPRPAGRDRAGIHLGLSGLASLGLAGF